MDRDEYEAVIVLERMKTAKPRLEPVPEERIKELGLESILSGMKVYGILRRCDLDEEVRCNMADRVKDAWLRILKSRSWILPHGFPQLGWFWVAVIDSGLYKSEFNGPHDLDGGRQCDLCHKWHRYTHILRHNDWDTHVLVGGHCSVMLSDVDPKWAEKKLAAQIAKAEQERQWKKAEEDRRLQAKLDQFVVEFENCQAQVQQANLEYQRWQQAALDARIRTFVQRFDDVRDEVQKTQREEEEAKQIAQEMLSSFLRAGSLDQTPANVAAVVMPPKPISIPAQTRSYSPTPLKTRLRVLIDSALKRSMKGNYTFRINCNDTPITGTVYKYGDEWKYVWNLPRKKSFSKCEFSRMSAALEALIDNLTDTLAMQWSTVA